MYPADSSYIDNISWSNYRVLLPTEVLKCWAFPWKTIRLRTNVWISHLTNRYLISVVETGKEISPPIWLLKERLTGDTIIQTLAMERLWSSSEANGFSINTWSVEECDGRSCHYIQVAAETDWQPVVDPSQQIGSRWTSLCSPDTKSRTFTAKTTADNPSSNCAAREGVVMVRA